MQSSTFFFKSDEKKKLTVKKCCSFVILYVYTVCFLNVNQNILLALLTFAYQ